MFCTTSTPVIKCSLSNTHHKSLLKCFSLLSTRRWWRFLLPTYSMMMMACLCSPPYTANTFATFSWPRARKHLEMWWFLKADKKLVHSPHWVRLTFQGLLPPCCRLRLHHLHSHFEGEVIKVCNHLHLVISIRQVSPLLHSTCPGQQCPKLPDQERGCPHQVLQLQVGIVPRVYWGPPWYIIYVFVDTFFILRIVIDGIYHRMLLSFFIIAFVSYLFHNFSRSLNLIQLNGCGYIFEK